MSTPTHVGETLWTAKVSPVAQLEALDMNAPLSGHEEARKRAAELRARLEAEDARPRALVTSETLRRTVR